MGIELLADGTRLVHVRQLGEHQKDYRMSMYPYAAECPDCGALKGRACRNDDGSVCPDRWNAIDTTVVHYVEPEPRPGIVKRAANYVGTPINFPLWVVVLALAIGIAGYTVTLRELEANTNALAFLADSCQVQPLLDRHGD